MRTRKSDHTDHFRSLVENGMDFVESGISDLWDIKGKKRKYAILNFYSGIELLLKARLLHEHWSLCVDDIRKADINRFESGDFISVNLDGTISRLEKILGIALPSAAVSAFRDLRAHRNRLIHFYHPNLKPRRVRRKGEEDPEMTSIVKDQLKSWFFLRRIIQDQWGDIYTEFGNRIDQINGNMKKYSVYLNVVWEHVRKDIENFEKFGHPAGLCRVCGYHALTTTEVGPDVIECRVCSSESTVVGHACRKCSKKFLVDFDGRDFDTCPHCETDFALEDALREYSDEGRLREKELFFEGGFAYCTYCEYPEKSVGTINEIAFCFECLEWHDPIEDCHYCGERCAGDLENSYYNGCPRCNGWQPRD
jgi:hypothetical protein